MELLEMIVTGECTNSNPYRFQAHSPNDGGKVEYTVNIVMPLGGAESGLYRSPRKGETVLVAKESQSNSSTYYLMGYLPGTNQPFTANDKNKVIDDDGEVFRYKKTGENDSKDGYYSEIGFYNKATSWRMNGGNSDHPKIDRINIYSTGDLHENSANHHKTSAKRFELLVDCADDASSEDSKNEDGQENKRSFGDYEGDDPTLYAGDAHLRAKNRILIKAGAEIRLQVGRSAIVISDDGITITSKKTQKNVALPWDTVINLTPRDGITMFGQNVNVGAAYNFSLRESSGGAVSSMGGVMRLSARDLLAQSYCKVGYQVNMADFIKLYSATIKGMQSGEGDVPSYTSLLPSLVQCFSNINWGYYSSTSNYSDPAGDYAAYCGTILQILSLTYTSLDLSMSDEMKQNGGRDAFNAAALADQQEKMQEMLSYIDATGSPDRAAHNSFMHLTSSAGAVLSGYDNERLSVNITDGNAPLAGLNGNLIAKETARLRKENSAEAAMRVFLKDEKGRIEEGTIWALGMNDYVLNKLKEL
ncbi:MAG: hypothetical protein LBC27_04415 [Spirochaetaceae bacterium]|jgi:hypothetical protein|nr:hypothetical protein [Spirochaetaceae bacterium]